MKTVLLAAALLVSALDVKAALNEVQFGSDAPVTGNVVFNPLTELAHIAQTNTAPRLRLTWFFNGMEMQDSGTLLYNRDT